MRDAWMTAQEHHPTYAISPPVRPHAGFRRAGGEGVSGADGGCRLVASSGAQARHRRNTQRRSALPPPLTPSSPTPLLLARLLCIPFSSRSPLSRLLSSLLSFFTAVLSACPLHA
eukprot:2879477-Rhodomonas_salina.1